MDSSVSPKDEIWFLRVCHHISTGLCHTAIYNMSTIAQLVKIIVWILWGPEVHQRECRSPHFEIVHSKFGTARCQSRALMQRSFVYLTMAIQDYGACNSSILPTSRIASKALSGSFTFKPGPTKRCHGGQQKCVLLLLNPRSRALL